MTPADRKRLWPDPSWRGGWWSFGSGFLLYPWNVDGWFRGLLFLCCRLGVLGRLGGGLEDSEGVRRPRDYSRNCLEPGGVSKGPTGEGPADIVGVRRLWLDPPLSFKNLESNPDIRNQVAKLIPNSDPDELGK
jgi:hypothetical protein